MGRIKRGTSALPRLLLALALTMLFVGSAVMTIHLGLSREGWQRWIVGPRWIEVGVLAGATSLAAGYATGNVILYGRWAVAITTESALRIITWVLTVAMLVTLAIGTVYSHLLISTWYYVLPAIGASIWFATMVIVAILGALALIVVGRVGESIVHLFGSLVVNFLYLLAVSGFASIHPWLVIPPALALNGTYIYLAWRFLLSPEAHRTTRLRLARIRDSLRRIWESLRRISL